ncbi:MAG: hypothetical protein KAV87_65000 [Desulfobacteraceae bacterium]|nr:hypothetical protein [Desulfobacteraceae bacterium]
MASNKQRVVRAAFKQCTRCFANQPDTGGVEPPAIGPRSREWWYQNNDGQWYYNNFMQDSMNIFLAGDIPNWCRSGTLPLPRQFYVDQRYPDVYSRNASFTFSGSWWQGGTENYWIRRSYWGIDISAILQADADKSNFLGIIFAYMNAIHPIEEEFPKFQSQPVYQVAWEGEMPNRTWNTQFGLLNKIGSVSLLQSNNSNTYVAVLEITGGYKELVADGQTRLNICLKSNNETFESYPWGPMTFYMAQYGGKGFSPIPFLAYY